MADLQFHPVRRSDAQGGPLYREVAAELRRRIREGRYAPGSKIPGLHELVGEFGVSTITIRRAIRELTSEGLLYGQQGLGVFIKPKRKIHRLLAGDPDKSIGDEIRRAGFEPHFHERAYHEVAIDPSMAERLGVRAGTKVQRHDKVTFVENEAVSLHSLYIPIKLAKQLRYGLTRNFIFALLREQGIALSRSRFEFQSTVVDQELSGIFNLAVGFPLLQIHYTPIAKDGRPLLTGVTVCRSDMFIFEVDMPGTSGK